MFLSTASRRVLIEFLFSNHIHHQVQNRSSSVYSPSRSSLSTLSVKSSALNWNNTDSPRHPHQFQISTRCSHNNATFFSRFSANNIMTGTDTFRISDYDVIGFDLDNTLLRYKVSAMVKLEYECLANYLVNVKGYPAKHLRKPLEEDLDFVQKGLIIDLARGNVLKVSADGFIRRASHGTRFMDDEELCSIYGADRKWDVVVNYAKDMLLTWNGPLAESMRSLLDYFDMPASLVFARCVDSLDEEGLARKGEYGHWADILDGIYSLYSREHFQVIIIET